MAEATTIENGRLSQLQEERNNAQAATSNNPSQRKSFMSKVSQHWLILVAALFFEILGLIPFLGVVFNFLFAIVLFFYFGPKRKSVGSELKKIGLPMFVGSIFDLFLVGAFPATISTTLYRIWKD